MAERAERLPIEFAVEKTYSHPYGYEEKYLRYGEQRLGYKAIVKDGKLLAIVKRYYRLIPNELVLEKLKGVKVVNVTKTDTRLYVEVKGEADDVGALVVNSVDGSHALSVVAMVRVGDSMIPMKSQRFEPIRRVHKKNVKFEELDTEIELVLKGAVEVKKYVEKIFQLRAFDYKDVFEALEELIPKKYVKDVVASLYVHKEMPVKDVYEAIVKRIWNSKVDVRTKLMWLEKVNDAIFIISEVQ